MCNIVLGWISFDSNFIFSISGIVIAVSGLLYTYCVSRRVDKQQIKINDSILSDNKKADFKAWIDREQRIGSMGKIQNVHRLKIENIGKQCARCFSVDLPDEEMNAFSIERIKEDVFHPFQIIERVIAVHYMCPKKMNLKIKWDDDFEKNREKECVLTV